MNVNSHQYEYAYLRSVRPSMVYDGSEPLDIWQKKARAKLIELLGLPSESCEDDLRIEYTVEFDDYTEIRFLFQSEPSYYVPCHLLVPKNVPLPAPVTLCLSGHGGGMHVALGRIRQKEDEEALTSWPHRAMALRAIRDGRCALVISTMPT